MGQEEEEFVRFVAEIAGQVVDKRLNRLLAIKDEIQNESNIADLINYGKLDEDDYIAANLTNLSNKRDVIERKASYIPTGLAEYFAVAESVATSYPPPVANRLVMHIRILTHFSCGEEGKALADFNTAISRRGTKYYPHIPVEQEDEEGGGFI